MTKSRLIGYRSVNVSDKKSINKLSVGKRWRQKPINRLSIGKVLTTVGVSNKSMFVRSTCDPFEIQKKFSNKENV